MRYKAVRRMRDVAGQRSKVTGAQDVGQARTKHSPQASGIETRTRIRAYLRDHPGATGKQIAADLGLAQSSVSYHRKRLHDDVEAPPGATSLDALLDNGFDPTSAADVLDGIVQAYMDGQVAQALSCLTPAERKYVVLRFWHGCEPAELTAAFGYAPHALWRTAKARLAPVLADLVDA